VLCPHQQVAKEKFSDSQRDKGTKGERENLPSFSFPSGRNFKRQNEGEDVSYETIWHPSIAGKTIWNPRPEIDLAPRAVSDESESFRPFFLGYQNGKYSI
jgi:hypothetical protein